MTSLAAKRTAIRLGRLVVRPTSIVSSSSGPSHIGRSSPRTYATLSPMNNPPPAAYQVFDEDAKARQRDRAIRRLRARGAVSVTGEVATTNSQPGDFQIVDYLREEVAERLGERIEDIKNPPSTFLEIASHAGILTRVLQEILGDDLPESHMTLEEQRTGQVGADGRRQWWMLESSKEALWRDPDESFPFPVRRVQAQPSHFLDNHELQEIRGKVDCVVSSGGLGWVGDIVGSLTQIRHLLKPDGVFVGAVFGGDTLFELRTSLQLAEQEREGGLANRVSPMITSTDVPGLLNRAGFTLTTVDVEDITISYPSIWELMEDLRDMGETNAIMGRKAMINRDVLLAAEAIYKDMYAREGQEGIPATFQVIFMIGWKPAPSQPKPLERGSGKTSMKDVL